MKTKNKFWNFVKNETDEKTADLNIYGYLSNDSWWGDEVTPKDFAKDLKDLGDIENLNIYINSGGGDVFAGQTIYSIIKRHKSNKTTYIDGLAASAASIVAMAGDTVIMPINAMLMIHNPWTFAVGEAKDFIKIAEDLDKIKDSIVAVYKDKTGLTEKEIIDFMDSETWFTAEESKEFNFIDKIDKEKQVAACIKGGDLFFNNVKADFSNYRNAPEIKEVRKVINVTNEIDLLFEKVQERKRREFK